MAPRKWSWVNARPAGTPSGSDPPHARSRNGLAGEARGGEHTASVPAMARKRRSVSARWTASSGACAGMGSHRGGAEGSGGAPASVVKPGQKMRSRTREATRSPSAAVVGFGGGSGGAPGEASARARRQVGAGARVASLQRRSTIARASGGSSATSAPRHPTTKGSTRVRTRTVPRRASASRDSTTGPYRSAPLSGSIRASARDTAVDTSVKRLSGLAARVARSVSSESATRTSAGVSGGRISDPPPRRAHQDASESEDASPSFSTVTTSRIADAELPMATRARSRSSEAADPSNGSRTFFLDRGRRARRAS